MKSALFSLVILCAISCNTPGTNNNGKSNNGNPINVVKSGDREPDSLPVVPLSTVDGGEDDDYSKSFKYPKFAALQGGDSFKNSLAAYGGAYRIWLGPKNWTGHANLGADGNVVVGLYPDSSFSHTGPYVSYYEVPACSECMLEVAAMYFTDALKDYNENYNRDNTSPIKIPDGLQIKHISESLVTYTLPIKNGLITFGVAYYGSTDSTDINLAEAAIVLPAAQASLAHFLVKKYIIEKNLE